MLNYTMTYDSVFIVDDNPTINVVHKHLFKKISIAKDIRAFTDPENALKELQKALLVHGKHVLVFLDINMPEMTGFEFLDQASLFPGVEALTDIIMVSSSIDFRDMERGKAHPLVQRYITKPLKKEEIHDFVRYRSQMTA